MSGDFDNYLGKKAKDIDPETIKLLLDEGYSISPKSGRIRKRLRVREHRPLISKRLVKKYGQTIVWIIVGVLFVTCLIILVPQMGVKKKPVYNSAK